MKIIYSVWYGCHEESGTFGHYDSEEQAKAVLAEVQPMVGKWTEYGDCIQAVGIEEIELNQPRRNVLALSKET